MYADVTILPLDELAEAADALAEVYLAAFSQPPYYDTEEHAAHFAGVMRRNAERRPAGFRCCVARDAPGGELVGFGYGFTLAPGERRYDLLRRALPADLAAIWLTDTFDLIDLAVVPASQGQGLGARLHDALLDGQPHRRALLTAYDGETVALRLYRSRGWQIIARDFRFAGDSAAHLVLGLDLSRRAASR
jgi:GNAT superfamily N-acetyltransferase